MDPREEIKQIDALLGSITNTRDPRLSKLRMRRSDLEGQIRKEVLRAQGIKRGLRTGETMTPRTAIFDPRVTGQGLFSQTPVVGTPEERLAVVERNLPGAPMLPNSPLLSPQVAGAGTPAPPAPAPTTPSSPGAGVSGGQAAGGGGVLDELMARPGSAFAAQAEASPELAAFKAALDAPAPIFQGLAFNRAEKAALGFLAGLRGPEAVLPIIEMRRRDAAQVYEAARQNRAERLEGLYRAAQMGEEQRRFSTTQARADADRAESQRRFEIDRQFEERRTKATEESARSTAAMRDAMLKARTSARPIPANAAMDIGQAINAARRVRDTYDKFIASGQPGGAIPSAFGLLPPMTQAQGDFAADLQITTNEVKKDLLGASRTMTELKDVSAFLPNYGDRDFTVRTGLRRTASASLAAVRAKIGALRSAGFDTSGLEEQLRAAGFAGADAGWSGPIQPLPPGVQFDPLWGVIDDAGDFAGMEE